MFKGIVLQAFEAKMSTELYVSNWNHLKAITDAVIIKVLGYWEQVVTDLSNFINQDLTETGNSIHLFTYVYVKS